MSRTLRALVIAVALAASAGHAQPLPEGDCAGVYWDLTVLLEPGDQIHARVLVSRAGPGERIAASQGHWQAPGSARTPFQNGRLEGRFEIDESGRSVEIGSTRLDLSGQKPLFEVDNDKRGVKLRVEMTAAEAIPVQTGDLSIAVLQLGGLVRASLWRRGMDAPRTAIGHVNLVRTTHTACERDLAAWRVDVHQLVGSGASSLLIHERLASGEDRSWLGWRGADGALHTLRPGSIAFEDWRRTRSGDRLPRRLRSKDPDLEGTVAFGAVQHALDPLDALPRLVRMLYWFGASPRRVWVGAEAELIAPAHDSLPRGPALATFTFLRATDE